MSGIIQLETIHYSAKKTTKNKKLQPKWQRIVLLSVLGYEAVGCLLGGCLLIVAPDGKLMNMPVDIMHGTFQNFLIPGIILFMLGVLNTVAFVYVLQRRKSDWIIAGLALGGLLIWFWVEIAILQRVHWLHAMWGLPVVLGGLMVFSLIQKQVIERGLLYCGIISSLLYVAINIIVPIQWPDYNAASQTISELSAIGAPTQTLWTVLSAPYTLLVIAFAIGMWRMGKENRWIQIGSVLLLIYGALYVAWPFAPMHLRTTLAAGGYTSTDAVHTALMVINEIVYLLALFITALAFKRSFRIYSVITAIALAAFGLLSFIDTPKIVANKPTPLAGIWERINISVFLLWIIVLAILLLLKSYKVKEMKTI